MTTRLLLKSAMLGAAVAICSLTASAQETVTIGVTSTTPDLANETISKLETITLDYSRSTINFTGARVDLSNTTSMMYLMRNDGTKNDPKYLPVSVDIQALVLDDNKIEVHFTPAITEAAEYYFYIPKGLFVFSSDNDITYISDQYYKIFSITPQTTQPADLPKVIENVTPAPGKVALMQYKEGINSIALNFANKVEINNDIKSGIEMYYAARPYAVETIKVGSDNIKVNPDNDKQVLLTFTKGNNVGTFSIKVPANMFKVDGTDVEAFQLDYNVVLGEKITLSPEEGPVESLSTIYLSYEDVEYVTYRDYTFKEATFTYADGTPIDGLRVTIANDIDNRTISFTLNKIITEIGSYVLKVPAGAIAIIHNDGTEEVNEEHLIYYEIVAVPKPIILPRESSYNEMNLEDLQSFRLSFANELSLKSFEQSNVAQWDKIDKMGNVIETTNFKVDEERTAIGTRIVYLVPATEADAEKMANLSDGDYLFTVAADSFTFSKEGIEEEFKNTKFVYTYKYKISGVESIFANNEKVTVVSIDGKVLMRDAEPAALNTLDKGLYIINGRKHIIK